MRLLLGLVIAAVPAIASGQPSAPAPVRVAIVPAITVAPPGDAPAADVVAASEPGVATGLARRSAHDAAAGRTYFTETALTGPRGQGAVELRMAPGAAQTQVRFAVTARVELGVSGLAILDGDRRTIVGLHGKARLWHSPRAAVAVAVDHYRAPQGDGLTAPALIASTCLDGADCLALMSASVRAVVAADPAGVVPVFAGLAWALGRRVQFIGEINYARDDRGAAPTFGYLGARAGSGRIAVDAGVGFQSDADPACTDCNRGTGVGLFGGVSGRI